MTIYCCFLIVVLPPDEDAQPFRNNSVYTNVIAALSIQLAQYISGITNKTVPQQWLDVASNLYFPFDNSSQTYLEYEGFQLSKRLLLLSTLFIFVSLDKTIIKQADVVLLDFPLMWPMSDEVKRNDLLAYEAVTRSDGPAMTWSMHSIGFLELGDYDKADQNFRRSYAAYVRPPFNVRHLGIVFFHLRESFIGMDRNSIRCWCS